MRGGWGESCFLFGSAFFLFFWGEGGSWKGFHPLDPVRKMLFIAFPFPRRGLQLDAGAAPRHAGRSQGTTKASTWGPCFPKLFRYRPGKMKNVRAPNRENPLTLIARATAEIHQWKIVLNCTGLKAQGAGTRNENGRNRSVSRCRQPHQ